jgi:hypothetical protein
MDFEMDESQDSLRITTDDSENDDCDDVKMSDVLDDDIRSLVHSPSSITDLSAFENLSTEVWPYSQN